MTEPAKRKRGRPPADPASPKRCSKCGNSYPREHFGSQAYCQVCTQAYRRDRHARVKGLPTSDAPPDASALVKVHMLEEHAAAIEYAKHIFDRHHLPQTRCDCCFKWVDALSETESGHKLCDLCGYIAARAGTCSEHGSPFVFFASAVGGAPPRVPDELRERFAPKPVKLPMTNEEAVNSAAK